MAEENEAIRFGNCEVISAFRQHFQQNGWDRTCRGFRSVRGCK